MPFLNCPHFKKLRDDDTLDNKKDSKSKGVSKLSLKELDKKSEKLKEKDKIFTRKKKATRSPSISKIREHLRKIVRYHRELVNEDIPSVYPILGPANSDSESGSDFEDQKRKQTKSTLKNKY